MATCITQAQNGKGTVPEKIEIDGEIVTAIITEGDTLYIADLVDVTVTSPRKFVNRKEYLTYLRYRSYANKVYPYAVDAIRIFRELERVRSEMKRRKAKQHIRRLQKELKKEFEEPLKKLTKTQGRILVHMIEKELNVPIYYLIKDLRGGITANYWTAAGKLYGYQLRKGYVVGEDPILDVILEDFDISHPK
ncbi:MAG: DUF4294 domain-containing protein [Saprospiraceae bacterium]|nr:DUF4294 domain-containing protein [Saprospiraceae bacterium]